MMKALAAVVLLLVFMVSGSQAFRFTLDKKECFTNSVPYDGDQVHVSFVVVKSDRMWNLGESAVDLVVHSPEGYQIHDSRGKAEDKFIFAAPRSGKYKFCFYNLSPVFETVDFDLHVGHNTPRHEEKATDDHVDPLLGQVARLEESLYSVSFEQHWLQAQTERQHRLNLTTSKRIVYKAIVDSVSLMAASLVQVYLLRRLFEKSMASSRV